jgi:SAM-dependent methyltransferase
LSNFDTVLYFYSSLLDEVNEAGYNSQEISLLGNIPLYYGRYLKPSLRNYFVQTVIQHIASAISYFSMDQPNPYIFDLGCGLGMQSIIFASLGAKVAAMDISEEAVLLCKKRKAYYENKLNVDLDIEFIQSDFRRSHQRDFNSKFDCLFSMGAFSYITPLERTVKLISSILKDDAKVFLYEMNSNHLLYSFKKSKEPNPQDVIHAFKKYGFNEYILYGGCSIPRFFWKFPLLNRPLLRPFNNILTKSLYLSFNYVLSLKRGAVKYPFTVSSSETDVNPRACFM